MMGFAEGLNPSCTLQGFGGSLGANAALPDASPPPELWVASSSQSCRIPYSSSGVLYSSGAASNFSPLAAPRSLAVSTGDLPVGRRCNFPVESPLQKYFASPVGQIISTSSRHPVPQEGRIAIVTDAGWDAVDAAASGVKRDAGRV